MSRATGAPPPPVVGTPTAPPRAPSAPMLAPREHLESLRAALADFSRSLPLVERWGRELATLLPEGQRLLAAGKGGSAAEAQHLTAELVGRFRLDRPAFSAIALHADTSALTALTNDYGAEEMFARQVDAHGRPGDVLVLFSTSGRSPNLLRAAERASSRRLRTWALTGPAPNPLAEAVDEALAVPSGYPGTVQELHLVGVHLVCAAFDTALGLGSSAGARPVPHTSTGTRSRALAAAPGPR